MKNSLTKETMILEPLPLPLSTHTNVDRLFSYDNFLVAVNYYVLRPK
jgi:hypothetical protein